MKTCSCGSDTERVSGVCDDCLKDAAAKFWAYVESCRPARLEVARRNRAEGEDGADPTL